MTESEIKEAICWCNIFADIDGCNPNHKIMKRCVEALEKQMPQKPKVEDKPYITLTKVYYCSCGSTVGFYNGLRGKKNKNKFCHVCGQAIDWSGE